MPMVQRPVDRTTALQGEKFGIREIMQILALGEAVIQDKGIIGATTHALSRAYRSSKLEDARMQAAQARAIGGESIFQSGALAQGPGGPQSPQVAPTGTPADPTGSPAAEFVSPVAVTPSGPMTAIPMDADTVAPLGDPAPEGQGLPPMQAAEQVWTPDQIKAALHKLEGRLSADEREVPSVQFTPVEKEAVRMARASANIPTDQPSWGYGKKTSKAAKKFLRSAYFAEPAPAPAPAPEPVPLGPSVADVDPGTPDFKARLDAILAGAESDKAERMRALKEKNIFTERELLGSMTQVKSPEELVHLMSLVPELVETDPDHSPRSLGELMGYDRASKVEGVWGNMLRAFQFLQRPDVETQKQIERLSLEARFHEIGEKAKERRLRREQKAAYWDARASQIEAKVKESEDKSKAKTGTGGLTLTNDDWYRIFIGFRNTEINLHGQPTPTPIFPGSFPGGADSPLNQRPKWSRATEKKYGEKLKEWKTEIDAMGSARRGAKTEGPTPEQKAAAARRIRAEREQITTIRNNIRIISKKITKLNEQLTDAKKSRGYKGAIKGGYENRSTRNVRKKEGELKALEALKKEKEAEILKIVRD